MNDCVDVLTVEKRTSAGKGFAGAGSDTCSDGRLPMKVGEIIDGAVQHAHSMKLCRRAEEDDAQRDNLPNHKVHRRCFSSAASGEGSAWTWMERAVTPSINTHEAFEMLTSSLGRMSPEGSAAGAVTVPSG